MTKPSTKTAAVVLFLCGATPLWLTSEAQATQERCTTRGVNTLRAAPAALTHAEVLKKLRSTSPGLTEQQVQAKIAASPDAFRLYRAFVPAYYDALKTGGPHSAALKPLEAQTGWIFGDVHPENFGAVLLDDGEAIFTINDLDDGAKGPLYNDLIRFLAAVRLHDRQAELGPLLKAYRKGLAGDDIPKSSYAKSLRKEAEDKGQTFSKKRVDKDTKTLIRDEDTSEVSDATETAIERVITRAYGGDTELKDTLAVRRDSGGSGGLKRYYALVRMAEREGTDKRHVLIEFKQLVDPSISRFTSLPQPPPAKRLELGLKYAQEQEGEASRFYKVQKLEGEDYLLRPRFAGNEGVKLDEVDSDELPDLLRHEAGVLGLLHSASASAPKAYRQALEQVPEEALMGESHRIAEVFREYFRALKGR